MGKTTRGGLASRSDGRLNFRLNFGRGLRIRPQHPLGSRRTLPSAVTSYQSPGIYFGGLNFGTRKKAAKNRTTTRLTWDVNAVRYGSGGDDLVSFADVDHERVRVHLLHQTIVIDVLVVGAHFRYYFHLLRDEMII